MCPYIIFRKMLYWLNFLHHWLLRHLCPLFLEVCLTAYSSTSGLGSPLRLPHWLGDMCRPLLQWFLATIGSILFGLIWSMLTWLSWMLPCVGILISLSSLPCGMHCWFYILGIFWFVDCCLVSPRVIYTVLLFCPLLMSVSVVHFVWCERLCLWWPTWTLYHIYFLWILVSCAWVLIKCVPPGNSHVVVTRLVWMPWLI